MQIITRIIAIVSIYSLILPWVVMGGTYSLELNRATTDYAYTNDSAMMSPTGDMTVMGWMKIDSIKPGNAYVFADKWNDGDLNRGWTFAYWWVASSTGFNASVCENTSCGASDQVNLTQAWNPLPNTWYHVAFVFNNDAGGSSLKVLVNGVVQNTSTSSGFTGPQVDNDDNVTLGAYTDSGTGNAHDGNFAEFQYWGAELKDSEVISYACTPPTASTTNLLAYWSLDNTDVSIPAGSDLTRSGSAVYEAVAVDKSGISSCPTASTNNPGGLRGNVNIKGGGNFYWFGN